MLGGSPSWARTNDLRINSPSLYRLSYRGSESPLFYPFSTPRSNAKSPLVSGLVACDGSFLLVLSLLREHDLDLPAGLEEWGISAGTTEEFVEVCVLLAKLRD